MACDEIAPRKTAAYDLVMHGASTVRRLAALFCVLLVLLAALTQSGASHQFAIALTLCFLIAIATFAFLLDADEQIQPLQALELPVFSPRPPPER
jgi:hypothetical protein